MKRPVTWRVLSVVCLMAIAAVVVLVCSTLVVAQARNQRVALSPALETKAGPSWVERQQPSHSAPEAAPVPSSSQKPEPYGSAQSTHAALSRFTLRKNGTGGWSVAGARPLGLMAGSIFAVSGAKGAANADALLGYVRLTGGQAQELIATPHAYAGLPARQDLPHEGCCELVYADYGPLKLRLSGDRADLRKRLRPLAEEKDSLIAVVDPSKADWLVRNQDGKNYLVPARRLGDYLSEPKDSGSDLLREEIG